jgi:hypothetical protein
MTKTSSQRHPKKFGRIIYELTQRLRNSSKLLQVTEISRSKTLDNYDGLHGIFTGTFATGEYAKASGDVSSEDEQNQYAIEPLSDFVDPLAIPSSATKTSKKRFSSATPCKNKKNRNDNSTASIAEGLLAIAESQNK